MSNLTISLDENKRLQSSNYQLVIVLGIAHALSDCVAGFLIGKLSFHTNYNQIGFLIALYNLLAFAGQMPAGLLLDRLKIYHTACIISLLVSMLGLLVYSFSFVGAIILIGLGSAFFHASGGAIAYTNEKNMHLSVGIFAGPGVLGLIIGGWLSVINFKAEYYLLLAFVIILTTLSLLKTPRNHRELADNQHAKEEKLEIHDALMIILLLAIAMRSAIWNITQLLYQHNYEWLFYLAIAAMAGKIIGGYLSDKYGFRNYAVSALLLVVLLLFFAEKYQILLIPGIFFLQSLTPVALTMMYQALPNLPATSAGGGLGMAIALGGIIFYLGFSLDYLLFILPILAVLIMLVYNLAFIKLHHIK
jgi:FSR family fosmidomycin resistance protein-like MFS transporter